MKLEAGKKYRPSNGSGWCAFMAAWCERCQREEDFHAGKSDSCMIICNSMCYAIDEPMYPEEWTYDEDGNPVCTAFEEAKK